MSLNRSDNLIRLLLVFASVDEAEQIVGMLRNGGVGVKPEFVDNAETLEKAIAERTPDLVIADRVVNDLNFADICDAATRGGRDVALIAAGNSLDSDSIVSAFRDGASAMIVANAPDLVPLVVRREFEALTMRRSVRRLEAALRESERRGDALLDSSRDPIAFVHEGMHVRANRAYLDVFGFTDPEDVEGVSILDLIDASDSNDFKALLRKLSKGEKPPQRLNVVAQRADNSTFNATMEFAEASFEGEPCQRITLRSEVSMPELEQELDALRSKDLVTGLYNRRHLLGEIERAVADAAAGRSDRALLLIEPDDFRRVIDAIGIGDTDIMLADMARLLQTKMGDADVAGRVAEDTFGLLVTARNADMVTQLADRIRGAFAESIFEIGEQSISVTVSIGMTLLGEKNANTNAALALAQSALRDAQAEGGDRVALVDPSERDRADAESARRWLERIDDALERNRFVLFGQPIISLHGAEGDFQEILLRMEDAQDLSPAEFLPIAELHQRMAAIDRWVIATAIRALTERNRGGSRSTFFIKLSAQSIADETLLAWIAEQLHDARQRGDALVFVMPESKVVTNLKPARMFAEGLKQFHATFALDQFGAGLNSFQLLKHVPAHYLKIDRSFMRDLPNNKENQGRIRDICEQAHQAGKLTVAEFVEDAASMAILFNCGVNFAQGDFLQGAEPLSD